MEKGILTSELESKLGDLLDNAIKLTGIWEIVDGPAFKLVIMAVDNSLGDKIPEPYKTELRDLLTQIMIEQDYTVAAEKAAALADKLIDIPGLDDETEAFVFRGIFTTIAGLLIKA